MTLLSALNLSTPPKRAGISVAATMLSLATFLSSSMSFAQPPERPPMPVKVISAEIQSVPYIKNYPARLTAFKEVEVHARITANIEARFYTEGQEVKKGQKLYQLDDRRAKADYNVAKAQEATAKVRLNQAKKTYERTKGLGRSISAQEIDDTFASWKAAQAELNAAEAQLRSSQIELDDTTIEAEISGIIGQKQQDVGDLVDPLSGNTLLNTIRRIDQLYAEFSIADAEREKVITLNEQGLLTGSNQMKIRLLDSKGNAQTSGTVDFEDAQIDPDTGSQMVRGLFANPNNRFLPGQLVNIEVQKGEWINVYPIPQTAIIQNGAQAFVYLAKEGKASMQPVSLAGSYEDKWLISEGLQTGDQIIINNIIKLRPNSAIKPMTNGAENNSEAANKSMQPASTKTANADQ